MDDLEIIQDFLIESHENLSRVEKEILQLEDSPGDPQILGSIFRSFHTVKGTCGFLGFGKLESLTHQAENLLAELRDGKRAFSAEMASLILESLDSVQKELGAIETTGKESELSHTALILKLQAALAAEETGKQKCEEPRAEAAPAPPTGPATPVAAAPETPAPAPTAAPAPAAAAGGVPLADTTIRIDTRLVDRMINLVGELVLVRNQVLQDGSGGGGTDKDVAHRLNLITTELQESVMRSRMQPVGSIWNKIPRLVRDTATQLKKDIRLVTDGAGTEMDRTILEAVKDPLTHILRNSCDHGLEMPAVRVAAGKAAQGQVSLRAYHEGSQVVIEVEDDGKGINPAVLRQKAVEKGILTAAAAAAMSDREATYLVFHAGFSTAEKVTNISGRGVGMDVVRKNIESIGGHVELHSQVGVGTRVKIRIPLTLAIIPGLIVRSGGQTFVIPQIHLVELLRLQGDRQGAMETRKEGSLLRWRGKLIPLLELNDVLRLARPDGDNPEARNIAILEAEGVPFGLGLDRILSTREIVVKPLGKQLKQLNWFAGATILGDGSAALILDIAGLAARENVQTQGETAAEADEQDADSRASAQQQFLLFACGSYPRVAMPLALVDRLEKFTAGQLERTADAWVVQYRGELLRVAALAGILGSGGEECLEKAQINVIVVRNEKQVIGLAVDRILDVQSGMIEAPSQTQAAGLLASFILNGAATELLDTERVLAAANPGGKQPQWIAQRQGVPILLGAASEFEGRALRQFLELGGYRPTICGTGGELTRQMEGGGYQAALVDWPEREDAEWVAELERASVKGGIPVIGIGDEDGAARPPWVAGWCARDDRATMLRLAGAGRASGKARRP